MMMMIMMMMMIKKNCTTFQQIAKLANEQDEFGCTPLHYASEKGQLKTVLSLIDRGAVMNAKNNNRESPLHFAARYFRIIKFMKSRTHHFFNHS